MTGKTLIALAAVASFALIGCNGGDSQGGGTTGTAATTSGTQGNAGGTPDATKALMIDGSTTVFPIVSAMGEDFGAVGGGEAGVVVNKSGTGSGFQKFERGELDIATASRPIKDEEDKALAAKGIEYVEVPIAYDGVSVVVNPQNTWVTNMTLDELKKAWDSKSTVKMWSDINPAFPQEKINFYGPSDNHGTYEYFIEAVVGKKNTLRPDYQPNQEYTAIIQSVSGDKNGIAYVGFNYYDTNKDKVKAVTVNGVAPTGETILGGTYTPLSRPLFLYVSKKALAEKPEVKKFLEFAMSPDGIKLISEEAKYVPLPQEAYDLAKQRIEAGTAGSVFKDATPGMKIQDVLAKGSAAK